MKLGCAASVLRHGFDTPEQDVIGAVTQLSAPKYKVSDRRGG